MYLAHNGDFATHHFHCSHVSVAISLLSVSLHYNRRTHFLTVAIFFGKTNQPTTENYPYDDFVPLARLVNNQANQAGLT